MLCKETMLGSPAKRCRCMPVHALTQELKLSGTLVNLLEGITSCAQPTTMSDANDTRMLIQASRMLICL
jgi:hypothetical protein